MQGSSDLRMDANSFFNHLIFKLTDEELDEFEQNNAMSSNELTDQQVDKAKGKFAKHPKEGSQVK